MVLNGEPDCSGELAGKTTEPLQTFSPHYQKKPEAGPDVSHTEQTTSIEIKYPENKGVRHAANIRHRSGL